MDQRLIHIIESLLLNVDTLNREIARQARSEQFTATSQCAQLVERIRGACTCTLQNLQTIERRFALQKGALKADAPPGNGEDMRS